MNHSLSRYDYCDIMLSTLCLHKKIVGSDIEGTFILFYFVYLSIHGELPLQTAYMQSNAEATSVGAAEVSTYNKNHPDEGISEMCDCCTSVWLDSLGIGIQNLVQPRDYNS